jgi:ATP-dependent DNA ligase
LTPIFLEGLGGVDDLILDGEIVAWSKRLGGFEKYGHNKTVAIAQAEVAAGVVRRREGGKEGVREGGEEDRNLMYVVFDCLHVGGQGSQEAFARAGVPKCEAGAVSGMPLSDRRALLQAVISSLPRRLEIVAHREVPLSLSTRDVGRKGQEGGVEEDRLEALSAYYDHAVENGWEGLMLKRLDSRYSSQGGENGEKISREKGGWVKLKPDYAEVTDEMDLVLLGGYYKDGARWRGYPSRFLLGVWAEGREGKEGGKEGGGTWEGMRFHTFARVATGLNTWEREELQNLLKAHWIEGGPGKEFPPWIMPWKTATIDIPALWLDVRHAPMVVMSVKGAEMVPSRSYSVEWTLRFPRITRLRPDKALAGVMTVQELQALRERPGGLWRRQDGHAAKGGEKRGRVQGKEGERKRRARWVPLSAYATHGGMVEAEVKGSLFAGMKICLYGSEFTTRLPNARALVGLEEGGKEGGKEGVRKSGKEGWFSLEELHRVILEQGGQASTNLMEVEKDLWGGGEGGEEEAGGVEGGRGGGPPVTSEGNRHPDPSFISPIYGMDIQRSSSPGISKSPPQPQRYEQDVMLVPAGRPCLRTQAAMREARIDILVVDWLVECLGAGRRIEPRYEHYVGMARGTRRRMEGLVDRFGDPWIPGEGIRLEEVFARMPSLPPSRGPSLSGAWRCHVREGAWGDDEGAILRGVMPFYSPRQIIYADRYADCGRVLPPVGEEDDEEATDDKEVGTREAKGGKRPALPFTTLDAAVILLRLHGAKISSSLHANVTHVLVDREERRRYSLILARKRELRRGPHYACEKWVVDVEWVKASLKAGRLLDLQEGGVEECEEGYQRYVVSDQELKEGAGME